MQKSRFFLFLFSLLFSSTSIIAQSTVVTGTVLDSETKEPLPFANLVFTGTSTGAITDFDGKFSLSTEDLTLTNISISFLGYEQQSLEIKPGKSQSIKIKLVSESLALEEFVVKRSRRVKKDTAAISLFRKVIAKRDKHRGLDLNSYQYEDYTKTEFSIYNLKEKLTKRKVLKPFDFVFENTDTTASGNVFLPVLLKENLTEHYYQKDPSESKTIILADQFSGVDNDGLSGFVEFAFDDIEIYQNTIEIGGKGFVSPFSKMALASYKFFLTDSADLEGDKSYKLEFTPRRKQDLCFTGHAWIDDNAAAIKNIEMFLLNQTNLNYVSDMGVKQGFAEVAGDTWFKTNEEMTVNLNITKNKKKQSIRIAKKSSREKIKINEQIPSEVFSGDKVKVDDLAKKRDDAFWEEKRHTELTAVEDNVYHMVDRVKETKAYKRYHWIGHFFSSAYARFGPVEVGRYYQMFSWNELEGKRYRLGLRTTRKQFRDRFMLDGYLAYGDKDKQFKYKAGGYVHLKRKNNRWHRLGGHYQYDWSNFNMNTSWMSHDNLIVTAFRKSPLDNLFLQRNAHGFYEKELFQGFTQRLAATHRTFYSWPGSYNFSLPTDTGEESENADQFEIMELNYHISWGIGQRFFERNGERVAFSFSKPVLDLDYVISPKGLLGSDYMYQKVTLGMKQQITTGAGRTQYEIEGGKIFGQIPYPILTIPKGNESFYFDKYSYNMMNEFEYGADMWASFWIYHKFDGLIFNAIPLLKKMKLRSRISFKSFFGKVSPDNEAYLNSSNGLKDLNGGYAEIGFGLENILKIAKLDFMLRLTQRDEPTTTKFGIRFEIAPAF